MELGDFAVRANPFDFASEEAAAGRAMPTRPVSGGRSLLVYGVLAIALFQSFEFLDKVTDRIDSWRVQSNRRSYTEWVNKHGAPLPDKAAYKEIWAIMHTHNELVRKHPEWNLEKYDIGD